MTSFTSYHTATCNKKKEFLHFMGEISKGLGSRRGEIGPAIEMQTDLKYVYMVYFIEKNRNFICLVLKL